MMWCSPERRCSWSERTSRTVSAIVESVPNIHDNTKTDLTASHPACASRHSGRASKYAEVDPVDMACDNRFYGHAMRAGLVECFKKGGLGARTRTVPFQPRGFISNSVPEVQHPTPGRPRAWGKPRPNERTAGTALSNSDAREHVLEEGTSKAFRSALEVQVFMSFPFRANSLGVCTVTQGVQIQLDCQHRRDARVACDSQRLYVHPAGRIASDARLGAACAIEYHTVTST